VQDAKNWGSSSAVLAEPGIDQGEFREQVLVAAGFDQVVDNFDSMAAYFMAADFDPDGTTCTRMDEAVDHLRDAQEAIRQARVDAFEYLADLRAPTF
jgi:hypothetical protein